MDDLFANFLGPGYKYWGALATMDSSVSSKIELDIIYSISHSIALSTLSKANTSSSTVVQVLSR